MHTAEYPAPDRTLLHLSDTHLRAPGARLFDVIDGAERMQRTLASIVDSGVRPDALIFTGDLADLGEPQAYTRLRSLVEPAAAAIGARVMWVMGNHDDRVAFRSRLLDDDSGDDAPYDRVEEIDGLRIVTLDSSVPGHHHGEVSDEQLDWLAQVLREPAPLGTVLAMHHPPVPAVLDLAASVELREQRRLAKVLRGTFATFAGIPVSVASSTCYAQDLTVPVGGTRPQDGAQSYNLVHLYDDTVVHSVVPVDVPRVLEYIDPAESQRRLVAADVRPFSSPSRAASPSDRVALSRR